MQMTFLKQEDFVLICLIDYLKNVIVKLTDKSLVLVISSIMIKWQVQFVSSTCINDKKYDTCINLIKSTFFYDNEYLQTSC